MELAPDFDQSGWVYLYYSAPDESVQRVSRFRLAGDELDLATEQILSGFHINGWSVATRAVPWRSDRTVPCTSPRATTPIRSRPTDSARWTNVRGAKPGMRNARRPIRWTYAGRYVKRVFTGGRMSSRTTRCTGASISHQGDLAIFRTCAFPSMTHPTTWESGFCPLHEAPSCGTPIPGRKNFLSSVSKEDVAPWPVLFFDRQINPVPPPDFRRISKAGYSFTSGCGTGSSRSR